MNAYLNKLAPWEIKQEYYRDIHLGEDVKIQTELLNKQTKAFISTKLASADSIIASQERISEGIDCSTYGIERVKKGIDELRAAFEWGIDDVVWQIESSKEILKSIFEVFNANVDTNAREVKKEAEEAYIQGRIDDALIKFFEYENLAQGDFTVYLTIGIINLFHKKDREKALKYIDKAIKFATPKSAYYTSYALLHKALINRDLGLFEEAEEDAAAAVKLSPNLAEALYQNAQYNALLKNSDKAIPLLKKAIEFDINYCEKINNEMDFDSIRNDVIKLFEGLREKEAIKATSQYASMCKKLDQIYQSIEVIKNYSQIKFADVGIQDSVGRIKQLLKRQSYRDYLEANIILNSLTEKKDKTIKNIKEYLNKIISSYNNKINSFKTSYLANTKKYTTWLTIIWLGVPISIFLGIKQWYIVGPVKMGSAVQSLLALFKTSLYGSLITTAIYFIALIFFTILLRWINLKILNNYEVKKNCLNKILIDLKSI